MLDCPSCNLTKKEEVKTGMILSVGTEREKNKNGGRTSDTKKRTHDYERKKGAGALKKKKKEEEMEGRMMALEGSASKRKEDHEMPSRGLHEQERKESVGAEGWTARNNPWKPALLRRVVAQVLFFEQARAMKASGKITELWGNTKALLVAYGLDSSRTPMTIKRKCRTERACKDSKSGSGACGLLTSLVRENMRNVAAPFPRHFNDGLVSKDSR